MLRAPEASRIVTVGYDVVELNVHLVGSWEPRAVGENPTGDFGIPTPRS